MNRNLKISLSVLGVVTPCLTVTLLSIKWSDHQIINCQGSSALVPFLNQIAHQYQKTNKCIDITAEIGGSSLGVDHIARGLVAIGDSSKDPYEQVQANWSKEWREKRIKTVTIGWEAICIVYQPIKDCPSEINLDINKDNIVKLYQAFSGFVGTNDINLATFLSEDVDSSLKQKFEETKIIPYVRTGGSQTSGTAHAFIHQAHFVTDAFDKLTYQQQKALENGEYGNEIKVNETDDSNSRAWSIFNQTSQPGAMIYLSSGFVKTNQNLIAQAGYRIATCDKKEYLNGCYPWIRPLNCMFSLIEQNSKQIGDFFNWLFFRDSKEGNKLSIQYDIDLKSYGARPLNDNELKTMVPKDDLKALWAEEASDYQLSTYRKIYNYGASYLPSQC